MCERHRSCGSGLFKWATAISLAGAIAMAAGGDARSQEPSMDAARTVDAGKFKKLAQQGTVIKENGIIRVHIPGLLDVSVKPSEPGSRHVISVSSANLDAIPMAEPQAGKGNLKLAPTPAPSSNNQADKDYPGII